MWPLLTCFLTFLLIFPTLNQTSQASRRTPNPPGSAIIQRRRIVLVRSQALVKEFPFKKRAIVSYPIITGLDSAVLRRVRSLLDFKNIFDYSLREYREDTWLDEFNYVVHHNADYLLDITFDQSGSAAYPDDQSKHFLINLRNGRVIKAADVFENDSLASLREMVNRKLQAELKQILQDLKDSKSDPEDIRIAGEAEGPQEFKRENLEDFSVNSRGVTFLYDAGYPHAIQAFEPNGKYFFSYAELKPYIKPNGPLGQFIH